MKRLLSCIILIMIVLSGCSRKPESNVDLLDNKDFFDAEILEVGNEYNSDENRVYICDTMFADREFFI